MSKYFFIFLLISSVPAQQPDPKILLDSLIALSLKNNFQLQGERAGVNIAKTSIGSATMWEAPLFSVAWMDIPTASSNPLEAMERVYAFEQMIPFPGKNSTRRNAAESAAAMAEANYQAAEQNLILLVKKQFIMIYTAQRRLEVNAENQQLARQMIAAVQVKYAVGQSGQADVLRLETELSLLENQTAQLTQDLHRATAMLNTLCNQPLSRALIRLPEIILSPFTPFSEELQQIAVSRRRELAAMNSEVEMNRAEWLMARQERYPDWMTAGLYRERGDGRPDSWEIMLGLTLPIAPWYNKKLHSRIEAGRYRLEQSQVEWQSMESMIRFEVHQSWLEVKTSRERVDRFRQSILPNAQQSMEVLLSAYQTGQADFTTLLDSFRMLQMYKDDYYMEIEKYLSRRFELERAVGQEFDVYF
jgi:outer membrane protein TolC